MVISFFCNVLAVPDTPLRLLPVSTEEIIMKSAITSIL